MRKTRAATFLLPLAGALALAACGGEPEEKTYEVDATDESGGDLIVEDVDPAAVPVEVPDTAMTNVPADDAATEEGAMEEGAMEDGE
jgi:uncharacterized lipoprotein YmbA